MFKSEDLLLVSMLTQENSIASVAKRLNLTASAVSQRLSALEARTGLSFADRNGRSGIVLTSDGEYAAGRASQILSELMIFQDELNERRGMISGLVRIVAPFGFGRQHLAPLLGRFRQNHPRLLIELRLSDDLVNVPKTSWDILIRVVDVQDASFVSHTLSENRRLVCAAPSYIKAHGSPEHPEDLKRHNCIAICEDGTNGSTSVFQSDTGVNLAVSLDPCMTTNDGETALEWAMAGLGVVVRSEWSATPAIKQGRLKDVTPAGWSVRPAPIVALTTERYAHSARISAVLDYLIDNIRVVA